MERSSRVTPSSAKFTQLATCHDAPASSSRRLVTGIVHVPCTTPEGHQSHPRSDSIAFAPVNGPVVQRHDFWMSKKTFTRWRDVIWAVVRSEWLRYQSKLAAGLLWSGARLAYGVPGCPG